jgi:Ca2+-transporting ATPase
LALIYVPFLQKIFSTTPLKAGELALCFAASTVVFISVEIYKWFYRRSHPLES